MFTSCRNAGNHSLLAVLSIAFIGVMATSVYAQPAATAKSAPADEIEGRPKQIVVEALPASSESDAKWQAVVVMENSGTMDFRPAGTFEIRDVRGNVVQSVEFPRITVSRAHDRRFVFPVKTALAPGNYTLLARVDIGNGEVQQILTDIVIDRPSINAARVQADYPVPIS